MSTPASQILEAGESFRRRLVDRDAVAETRLWHQYNALIVELRVQQEALARAVAARGSFSPSQLMLDRRYRALLGQSIEAVEGMAKRIGTTVPEFGNQAVLDGMRAVSEVSGPTFHRLDRQTIERLTGATTSGPLEQLLQSFSSRTQADVAGFMRQTLITGAAMGTGADIIAKRLAAGTDNLIFTRARTIVRTEINRAHREATRLSIANNPIVAGWVWRSAADERTCVACLSLHGTFFPGSTPMRAHPNCRCVMVPKRTLKDDPGGFGKGTRASQITSLEPVIKNMPARTQDRWLGRTRAQLLRDGKIKWADLRTLRQNRVWGDSYQITPVRTLTGLTPARLRPARRAPAAKPLPGPTPAPLPENKYRYIPESLRPKNTKATAQYELRESWERSVAAYNMYRDRWGFDKGRWSGKLRLERETVSHYGVADWGGDIGLNIKSMVHTWGNRGTMTWVPGQYVETATRAAVWKRGHYKREAVGHTPRSRTIAFHTEFHELAHTVSAMKQYRSYGEDMYGNPRSGSWYQYRGWEEGLVEMYTRTRGRTVVEEIMGDQFDNDAWEARHKNHGYNRYTSALEQIERAIYQPDQSGLSAQIEWNQRDLATRAEFYERLMKVDIFDRYDEVGHIARELRDEGHLTDDQFSRVLQTLERADDALRRP